MPLPNDTQVHYVDNFITACEFFKWVDEDHEVVAYDLETTGLDPRDINANIRLAQLGDYTQGWAIPWDHWSGLFIEALERLRSRGIRLAGHNTSFDNRWLQIFANWKVPFELIDDTMIAAQVCEPDLPAGLKSLGDRHIDRRASAGQKLLSQAMKEQGWGWEDVPTNFDIYWQYGCLDTIITAHLWRHYEESRTTYKRAYDLEMNARRVVSAMEDNGVRIDMQYCEDMYAKLKKHVADSKKWAIENWDTNIGSTPQVVNLFQDKLGQVITKQTPSGAPSVDKEQLAVFQESEDPTVAATASFILDVKNADKKANSYFKNFLEFQHNGILHTSFKTLAARTGRMCIPVDHLLLTKNGPVHVDDICVGDETIDHEGNWTKVERIHRYSGSKVLRWDNSLASTEEHRWVWKYEDRNKIHIEPTQAGNRHRLLLSPALDTYSFPRQGEKLVTTTEGQKFAALVGMLITDGVCVDTGNGEGLRAVIYQSSNKFFDDLYRNIPTEAVMYTTSRDIPNSKTNNVSNEIRIRTRWLTPRLIACGLLPEVGSSLKNNPELLKWVLGLPSDELKSFMDAAYLCDGVVSGKTNIIHSQSSVSRKVFAAAGYRLGYLSQERVFEPSEWSNGLRHAVSFRRATKSLRNVEATVETSDVWCVTTASGTFTAWSTTPYLTGNSSTKPALQTISKQDTVLRDAFLPHEGHVMLSCDYSQVELRLMCHFSGDPDLAAAFHNADATGGDFFVEMGKAIYKDENFTKKDPRRNLIKTFMYAYLYGAGVAKMAKSANVSTAEMKEFVATLAATYPGIPEFQNRIISMGEARERSEGQGYVMTPFGRRIPCDKNQARTLVNYLLQGHAAEILKDALVKMDAAGLTPYMLLPIHDEVIASCPPDEYEDVSTSIGNIMSIRGEYAVDIIADPEGPFDRWGDKLRQG